MNDIEFIGRMNPQRLISPQEEFKLERAQILVDQKRFAKWGTNDSKKAELFESSQVGKLTYERDSE